MKYQFKDGTKIIAEHHNGEEFYTAKWLKQQLKFQDIEAWKKEPEEFDKWMKTVFKQAIDHLYFVIK